MPRRQGHTKSTRPWERRKWLGRNRRRQLGKRREAARARKGK